LNNNGGSTINLEYLKNALQKNPYTLKHIISTYLKVSNGYVKEINESIQQRDFSSLCFVLHKFKGASALMGGWKFISFLEKLQRAAQKKEWKIIDLLKEKLIPEYNQILLDLDKELPEINRLL